MEKAIRAKEVASRTGLPISAIRRYIQDGIIKSAQIGGKGTSIWILESEAEKLLARLRGDK